jgi:hypothetical protein
VLLRLVLAAFTGDEVRCGVVGVGLVNAIDTCTWLLDSEHNVVELVFRAVGQGT